MTGEIADLAQVALAVDLGGTKVEAALVGVSGVVVSGSRMRLATGADGSLEAITAAVESVIERALSVQPPDAELVGVGIGSAGPIDVERGAVSPINLPALRGYALREVVAGLSPDVPVRLALDGTCIALAEHRFGAARGFQNSLSVVVSTGVGGGFILGGRPVSGNSGNAGHIGQLRIERWNEAAATTAGTLESLASGPATVAWARSHGWLGDTGEELAVAYEAGDHIARRAVLRSAHAVGEAISSAATLLDLDVAVLAGGFVNVARDYIAHVAERTERAAALGYATRVRVVASGLHGAGPLIGAAALVIED